MSHVGRAGIMSAPNIIIEVDTVQDEHDATVLMALVLSGAASLSHGSKFKLVPVDGDGPQLRHDAPDTSRAAAERVRPKVGTQRATVLNELYWTIDPGATDQQISERTGIPLNSVRPRRGELVKQGWVRDSGKRRNGSIVWTYIPDREAR